jgi:hypothetical protein
MFSEEIAQQLSNKMYDRFQDIKEKLDVIDYDPSLLSENDEKFIRAFHAAEANGRDIYEFLLYADSPSTINEIYFSPQFFEMIFNDIRNFVKRHKNTLHYPSEAINNPYYLVDKSLSKKLFLPIITKRKKRSKSICIIL